MRRAATVAAAALLIWAASASAHPTPARDGDDDDDDDDGRPDYLIVGAGGSGIQTALLLHKHNYSYAVLEREEVVGSFWTKFPVFGELISVNKWVRNETQRLRYDWHSFLEAPLTMADVTDEYFPSGADWRRYMARVADEAGVTDNIEFGVEVERIAADGSPCVLLGGGGRRCARRRVFVGTGLREKHEPYLEAMGGTPYSRATREGARRKRVCILGNGNAGFEVAQNVFGVADRVVIYGKESHRLSSVTKYTGDVRVRFLQVLENLHGKLLDTAEKFDYGFRIGGLEGYLDETQIERVQLLVRAGTFLKQFECETFVIATGFRSHVPGLTLGEGRRFPPTGAGGWYAAAENPAVHYVGWLMHEADFRRGAGGFLSGYRYLIRNLVHHVRREDDGVPYPRLVLETKEDVVAHAVRRCQVADDLIILQDGVVLRDVIVPVASSDVDDRVVYHYYEGATFGFHDDITDRDGVMFLYFAWGDGRSVQSVFDNVLRYTDTNKLINLFLHPVLEVDGQTRDMMEDLEQAWNGPGYVSSIEKTVRAALDGDLSLFRPKGAPRPYVRSVVDESTAKEPGYDYEAAREGGLIDDEFLTALWRAVAADGADAELRALREATERWMPQLFGGSG